MVLSMYVGMALGMIPRTMANALSGSTRSVTHDSSGQRFHWILLPASLKSLGAKGARRSSCCGSPCFDGVLIEINSYHYHVLITEAWLASVRLVPPNILATCCKQRGQLPKRDSPASGPGGLSYHCDTMVHGSTLVTKNTKTSG